tara:strand:- start:374 stop:799 length:426 start_codon:yes stop_codon:yes gene_type:complete
MKNFRNNFRRSRYKNYQDRNNHKNENGIKMISDMTNGSNIVRKNIGRNNHNAPKLIEKYSNLAREALSNGDKILSESYYQYAEHFIRVLGEKEMLYGKNQKSKEVTDEKTESTQKNINNIDSNSSETPINSNKETILNSKN